MVQKSGVHQLIARYIVYPSIYKFSYIPGGDRRISESSTVWITVVVVYNSCHPWQVQTWFLVCWRCMLLQFYWGSVCSFFCQESSFAHALAGLVLVGMLQVKLLPTQGSVAHCQGSLFKDTRLFQRQTEPVFVADGQGEGSQGWSQFPYKLWYLK